MAAILAHDGYVFECEELQTGHVSMTVERPGEDWPLTLAHEVCVNGPRVPETIDALITKAYERAKMLKG